MWCTWPTAAAHLQQFTENWEVAWLLEARALFKKDKNSLPSNYRPVSLTCITCKLLEKIPRQGVMDHLRNHNILSRQQYGFTSGRSTSLQLLHILDDWTKTLDEGKILDVVYFDFKKAFDKVPHQRLFRSYGIVGQFDPVGQFAELDHCVPYRQRTTGMCQCHRF